MGHFQASSLKPPTSDSPCSLYIVGSLGLKMTEPQDGRGLVPSYCVPAGIAAWRRDIWIDTPILKLMEKELTFYYYATETLGVFCNNRYSSHLSTSPWLSVFPSPFPPWLILPFHSLPFPLNKGTQFLYPSCNFL